MNILLIEDSNEFQSCQEMYVSLLDWYCVHGTNSFSPEAFGNLLH